VLSNASLPSAAAWSCANFARVGAHHVLAHERLVRAARVHAGSRVLDIGAGTGNASIAAARRGGLVTAVDLVESSLELARRRAEIEGLRVHTEVADAHQLPFADAAFDTVLSTFGVMFAADPERAASELLRVCRSGGTIGVTVWTAGGFVGATMALLARYSGRSRAPSPARWGDPDWVRALLGDEVVDLVARFRTVDMCARSVAEMIDLHSQSLGPVRAVSDRLDEDARERFLADRIDIINRFNRADDGTVAIDAEYLEMVAIRR
jgi:SAM-dependent methyltransferase